MKLIERLGGYEAAKAEGEEWGFDDFLNNQLLEYRRQHNIFEAGDVAVSVDGEPYLHKVELGTSKAHCIKIFSHDMAHSYWVHDVNYRHATDAEIAAGKRLEVS
ncbi:hypothetical protein MTX11_07675 [Acinetobacter lwoffii]|uniref:hypothetical protein n=1 Tax=Acinetobacter lwoffii TaxID=28090 RepID=UPI001FB1C857|nr:hypothetical protein [Acinetobacter lwoffii]MCJ0927878.1 hypothetical protein [Acinetobacter lwoffii]